MQRVSPHGPCGEPQARDASADLSANANAPEARPANEPLINRSTPADLQAPVSPMHEPEFTCENCGCRVRRDRPADTVYAAPVDDSSGSHHESVDARKPAVDNEDVEDVRRARAPVTPSAQEVLEHDVTHIPYRNWCRHCVEGRGLGEQRGRHAPRWPCPRVACSRRRLLVLNLDGLRSPPGARHRGEREPRRRSCRASQGARDCRL